MVINEILFYGKKNLPWDKVEQYLKRYIGKVVMMAETGEVIHIGSDFPDEYKGSEDTRRTKGQYAKAKANAAQHGWYRYLTRFALPIMSEDNVKKEARQSVS